jgi:cation diffusion facilitator CzcD-associated flavoprotein CzcO
VAKVWDLRKDTQFDTFVLSATWSDDDTRWKVKIKDGETYRAYFLLLNTGFAAKRYIPDWKGIDSFKGQIISLSS